MAMTRDYMDFLDDQIGIAPANSQEELQAAQTIAEVFEGHGLEARIQEFDAPSVTKFTYGIVLIVLFVAMLMSGIGGAAGIVGFLLVLVCSFLLISNYFGRDFLENFGPTVRSQNVIACHHASGPLVSKGVRPIVVVAHYDTPREDILSMPQFSRYRSVIMGALDYCVPAVALLALLQLIGVIPGGVRVFFWIIGIVASLPPLLVGVSVVANRFMGCTVGANDNKASVAALLGVLESVCPGGELPERRIPEPAPAPEAVPVSEEVVPQEEGPKAIRHGAVVVRSIGMLPESCELEYVEAPAAPRVQVAPRPAPAPAAVPVAPATSEEDTSVFEVPSAPEAVPTEEASPMGSTEALPIEREQPVIDVAAPEEVEAPHEDVRGPEPRDAAPVAQAAPVEAPAAEEAPREAAVRPAAESVEAPAPEPEEEQLPEKDASGLDTMAPEEYDAGATAPMTKEQIDEATAPSEDATKDPDWGKTTYQPSRVNVARRASLFDLPDPSEATVDPLSVDTFVRKTAPAPAPAQEAAPAAPAPKPAPAPASFVPRPIRLDGNARSIPPRSSRTASRYSNDDDFVLPTIQDDIVTAPPAPSTYSEPGETIVAPVTPSAPSVPTSSAATPMPLDVMGASGQFAPVETGAPKKKHHLFGRKNKKEQESMSDWLGVEEDYDAKKDGREIGSWDNFDNDERGNGRSGRGSTGTPSRGHWKGGATRSGGNGPVDGNTTPVNMPVASDGAGATDKIPTIENLPVMNPSPAADGVPLADEAPEKQGPASAAAGAAAGVAAGAAAIGDKLFGANGLFGGNGRSAGGDATDGTADVQDATPAEAGKEPSRNPLSHFKLLSNNPLARKDAPAEAPADDAAAPEAGKPAFSVIEGNAQAADAGAEVPSAREKGVSHRTEEELREAILKMGDDKLICHDIWFVAVGSSALDHAGIKAFLNEYRSNIRGSFLINLDSVGAGVPTVITEEGLCGKRRADRRLVNLLTSTADDLHCPLAKMPRAWADTDATPAMRKSVRSATIMGLSDGGSAAFSHTKEDVPENVIESQVVDVCDLVTEAIRRS